MKKQELQVKLSWIGNRYFHPLDRVNYPMGKQDCHGRRDETRDKKDDHHEKY